MNNIQWVPRLCGRVRSGGGRGRHGGFESSVAKGGAKSGVKGLCWGVRASAAAAARKRPMC